VHASPQSGPAAGSIAIESRVSPVATPDQYADQRDGRQRSKESGFRAGAHDVDRSIDGLVASAGHARRKSMRQDIEDGGIQS
jgi:hypothetical protein